MDYSALSICIWDQARMHYNGRRYGAWLFEDISGSFAKNILNYRNAGITLMKAMTYTVC